MIYINVLQILFNFYYFQVIVSISRSQAQNDSIKINFTGSNVAFPKFVEEIENTSRIKLYYDPQWVDSLFVSAHFKNISIGQALKQILVKRNLHYYLDGRGNIIITKSIIQTKLKYKWVDDNSINKNIQYNNYISEHY